MRWLSYNGIKVSTASVIRSTEPPEKLYKAMIEGEGLTLHAWVTIDNDQQTGPARIISYSYGAGLRNFTLGQNNRDLIFRLRTTGSNLNGIPEIAVKDVFIEPTPLHLSITYDFFQYAVYVNGNLWARGNYSENFSNWDPSYFLTIANEFSSDRPWLGTIHKVAIFNHPQSHNEIIKIYKNGIYAGLQIEGQKFTDQENLIVLYLFNEETGNIIHDVSGHTPAADLSIPSTISIGKIPDQTFLAPLAFTSFKDIIVNIILFIPFGFLLHNIVKKHTPSSSQTFCIVLLAAITLTFSIESLQTLIETRSSAMTDIITNSMGALVGIFIARTIPAKLLETD